MRTYTVEIRIENECGIYFTLDPSPDKPTP